MIWIFDLDETLYDEKTFVLSGLNCVAQHLAEKSSYSESDLFGFMHDEFISNGRLRVFQQLKKHFADLEFELDKMIELFRSHVPQINLYNDASELLSSMSNLPIYLVTDGNRKSQWNKIDALGIKSVFKEIFVTDEHGTDAKKPNTKCFKKIKDLEVCEWQVMIYVGDDPNKDFINLKPLGMRTVRVKRGRFINVKLDKNHEASLLVNDLKELKRRADSLENW